MIWGTGYIRRTQTAPMLVISMIMLMMTISSSTASTNSPICLWGTTKQTLNLSRKHTTIIPSSLLNIRGGASKTKTTKKRKTGTGRKSASLHTLNSKNKTKKSNEKTATGERKIGSSQEKKSSPTSDLLKKYKAMLPVTRVYLTTVCIVNFIAFLLGEELAQSLLALDPTRVIYGLELWRPITSASFLGKPSIGLLMSSYYLFEYGSSLERAYGSAQHIMFLTGQIFLLSILSSLLGLPFFAPSVITSMLHVLSRSMPKQKVKWLIFTVPYWALPYGLMVGDVLQGGGMVAAVPHVLGILTGHFYFFHKFVWTKVGGEDWLVAPDWLVRRLEKRESDVGRESVNAALKNRKKKKGRKLGA